MSTATTDRPFWWATDPNVTACDACGCPVQGGPMAMSRHRRVVHPVKARQDPS